MNSVHFHLWYLAIGVTVLLVCQQWGDDAGSLAFGEFLQLFLHYIQPFAGLRNVISSVGVKGFSL